MKWLVTGASGMLGTDVAAVLGARTGDTVTAAERHTLDITSDRDIGKLVPGHDVVVNCAAWTDVDGAESDPQGAMRVNGYAPLLLARECRYRGIPLVHVSTDYAVSGEHGTPVPEDAPHAPVNEYGRGKAWGERAVREEGWVVRTAWLYGENGRNFVDTMRRLAQGADPVRVVNDQWGQPTCTRDLARRLVDVGVAAGRGDIPPGVYHGTASGYTSWYHLAREVFALTGHDPDRVVPVTSAEFVRPATRPAWSVLGHDAWRKARMEPMAHWRVMLTRALAEGHSG